MITQGSRAQVVVMCLGLMAFSVLSFADDDQAVKPKESTGELAHDKATFNHDQRIYNDKANKDSRAKQKVAQKSELNEQYNKKVQDQQDANKGQFIVKF